MALVGAGCSPVRVEHAHITAAAMTPQSAHLDLALARRDSKQTEFPFACNRFLDEETEQLLSSLPGAIRAIAMYVNAIWFPSPLR
jgi:hypothetical protein